MKLVCEYTDRGKDFKPLYGSEHIHKIVIEHKTAKECMKELIDLRLDHDISKYTHIEISYVYD